MYPPTYENLYSKLSNSTGMSKDEVDIFILKMIKFLTDNLHRSGETIVPYLGKFKLRRMPPRKRSVKDFDTGKNYMIEVEAQDKLTFQINKEFRKIFK
jgi:nucleoid DNA-binding protein